MILNSCVQLYTLTKELKTLFISYHSNKQTPLVTGYHGNLVLGYLYMFIMYGSEKECF